MKATIEKMDHQGQGITHVDGVVTFVPKCILGDEVLLNLKKCKKHYNLGEVTEFIKRGEGYQKEFCPFYQKCGGCHLQNLTYQKSIQYKCNKIKELFQKIGEEVNPIVIENSSQEFYRNKIELKIVDKKIGFFQEKSNQIVKIEKCAITKKCINEVIPFIKTWNICNGEVILRCNYNDEILIVIRTNDKIDLDIEALRKKVKLVGVVLNDTTIFGDNFFFERVNKLLFKVSYDSFFQVNSLVAAKLFETVALEIPDDSRVLDLYCGVGTFSLHVAKKCQKVVGVEVVYNAVLNAILNAKLNKETNVQFVLNDVSKFIDKINLLFDVWIIDPPRSGIDKKVLSAMLNKKPSLIVYVSCDPQTLIRDLEQLKKSYELSKLYIFDMFSYTYHVECVCVLKKIL